MGILDYLLLAVHPTRQHAQGKLKLRQHYENAARPEHLPCDTRRCANSRLCTGLTIFFERFLQQFLAQYLVRQHTLQTCVLLLKLLELLGLIDLQHPKLPLPAMERLLADPGLAADFKDWFARISGT
ncbi:MAG: hypothetical protein Q7Q73_09130 [Verrucomicrobiota bacterium JB024]|nr:hypothetical protein [Verrucomicrobiota bacterium JB024]